jgi:D-glycero-D-manno-heptose 1,7-bisphosphate phosphatase
MGIGSLTGSRRAVFLDRDGVVNRAIVRDGRPFPPETLAEMVIDPDAAMALSMLKQLGFLLIVVTNQPDVGRGLQSREAVDQMHEALRAELPLDDFFVCCHDDVDRCECRKPAPGLLLKAAEHHDINLQASFLIGDRWRDVDAGYRAGVQTALIDYGYMERGPDHQPGARVASLREAVDWIVRRCDTI